MGGEETRQELEPEAQGVEAGATTAQAGPGEGAQAGPGVGAGAATAQAAGETTAGPSQPDLENVNLDDLPHFREWKAKQDRERAQLEGELSAARQRLEEAERVQREAQRAQREARVRQLAEEADPDDLINFYEGELGKVEMQQQQLAEQQRLRARAEALLTSYGLELTTEGLDLSGGATPEGYVRLVESIPAVLAKRQAETAQAAQQQIERAAREGRREGILATGAARVGAETGGTPGSQNLIADIDDPDELLGMGLLGKGGRR